MAYLRISRDKRGYEYFSLVHASSGRRGKVRQRVLYWYRTPPNIKVGRSLFDEDVMRALEAQNRDIKFDWEALKNTPVPPQTIDWRERRLAQRAARQFRDGDDTPAPAAEERPAAAQGPLESAEPVQEAALEAAVPSGAPVPVVQAIPVTVDATAGVTAEAPVEATVEVTVEVTAEATAATDAAAVPGSAPRRRRRRRRGRRGRPGGSPGAAGPEPGQTEGELSASTDSDADELHGDDTL